MDPTLAHIIEDLVCIGIGTVLAYLFFVWLTTATNEEEYEEWKKRQEEVSGKRK